MDFKNQKVFYLLESGPINANARMERRPPPIIVKP
jgi:hypothetical protein